MDDLHANCYYYLVLLYKKNEYVKTQDNLCYSSMNCSFKQQVHQNTYFKWSIYLDSQDNEFSTIFFKTTAALICKVGKFGWNLPSFTNMFARYIVLQKQRWPVMLSPGKSYDWPSWMARGSNYSMERAMLGKGCSWCCEYKTKFIDCYRSLDVFRCHCISRMQWKTKEQCYTKITQIKG